MCPHRQEIDPQKDTPCLAPLPTVGHIPPANTLGRHAATRKWFNGCGARLRRGMADLQERRPLQRAGEFPCLDQAPYPVDPLGSPSTLTRASRAFREADIARANAPSSNKERLMRTRATYDLLRAEGGARMPIQSAANNTQAWRQTRATQRQTQSGG